MATTNYQEFHLATHQRQCALTGVELKPGDRFVAAIVEPDGEETLERLDFLASEWDAGHRPAGLFGYWRGVVLEKSEKPRPFIDDTSLLALFEQLDDTTEPRRVAFRFVLALILIRKRLLRLEGSVDDGERPFMRVRMRGPDGWVEGSTIVEVDDPGMDEEAVADVTEQLTEVLNGELS